MRTLIVAALLLAATGCASTGDTVLRDRDVLTLEEIEATSQPNAYHMIRGLRPHWLRVRGPTRLYQQHPIMVYVDGTRMGGPSVLNSIPRGNIREIRYYDGAQAQTRFGLNNTNGAIAVRTRGG